ncbi:Peroxisomal membrane protein PMP27 [Elasticomyces elasticus]|uniref:Peroxisomal membrane protein PMP27 n=1 Tax=Exophiala sideris TaxID=1016849 RepID=A0ABR0JJ24_9EURO|nr:Peroxisomal membrane protein PMP27 [Elasticomyces elasticus]KAK5030295.1 Peroxisomal membrane protein PMP27 [Exophiala sideris]KAK5035050.1 Peroxisomal membrane protein PMP27 [Exophiala sideris]KAK5065973.1 Peroxisomal membrane protein PMP27 [Exophiala sideris]KAK5178360.1 Peroxisomal membrane protein PMP27 [Eurotiomycetes sp. CCFEE 6388]
MVADALVYHPAVTHYLRYVATTVGRDKVLRTIQYFSRFYAWYLYRTNNPTSAIQPWVVVKNQFGLTRKILRIGKFVEHIRAGAEIYDAAVKSSNGDKVTQYLQILRQIGYAGYLTFDTMTVLDAMGVRKDPKAKNIQATAYRFWLTGLVASALAGIYNTYKLRQRAQTVNEKDAEDKVEKVKIAKQQRAVNIQLISDLCDLTVPSTALGYTTFDEGIVGLAGTTSSLLGMYGAWQKTA